MALVCLYLSSLSTATPVAGQQVVHNPEKPLAKNAARTIALKEVLRIKDDGKETNFRGPYDLHVGENGVIYFYDEFVLHEFDETGKLMAKMVKPGQGPGEAGMRTTAVIMKDKIIVLAISPPKLMVFDRAGRLLEEVKTDVMHTYGHFGLGGKMYVFRMDLPAFGQRPVNGGEIDVPITLAEFLPDFRKIKDIAEFPRRFYFVNQGIWYEWTGFGYALIEPDQICIHHTTEYKIIQFNMARNAVERIIDRKYKRINRPEDPPDKRPRGYALPYQKYYDDIRALLSRGDMLWAVTSTKNDQKNRLVDVFDKVGRYIDCFYLKFPDGFEERYFYQGRAALRGDFLYIVDTDLEGFKSIGKYRIED